MAGHNHRSWCSCGWCNGGQSYSYDEYFKQIENRSSFVPSYTWDYSYIERIYRYKSFINPNARCPVCNVEVYFYQSPYGGKVYFDELGPPWTKHGCTTTSKTPIKAIDRDTLSKFQPKWIRLKWKPFVCKETKLTINLQEVILISGEELVTCYGLSNNIKITSGSLVYLRMINDKYTEASILLEGNNAKTFILTMEKDNDENYFKELANFSIMEKYELPITNYRKYSLLCNTINQSYYETLISDENTSALILTYIFFRFFDKESMINKVIQHTKSVKTGMNDIFSYIIKLGIKGFIDNFEKEYRYYEDEVILILKSVVNVPMANGIKKIIENKERELEQPSTKYILKDGVWVLKKQLINTSILSHL